MPFVPPVPPPNVNKQNNLSSQKEENVAEQEKQKNKQKGKKILFSALAVLCFVAAVVMFTLMTVL